MQQTVILAREVEHVAQRILPQTVPTARIGVLRGMWQNWQKYWELVGTQRDLERVRAYNLIVGAGIELQKSLIEFHRLNHQLENIDRILEADELDFQRKREEAAARHRFVMTGLNADLLEAQTREAVASASLKLVGATKADSARAKLAEVAKIGQEYADALRDIETDSRLPEEVREMMRAQMRAVYEQSCRDISGVAGTSKATHRESSDVGRNEKIKRRRARCDVDIASVQASSTMSDAEKRATIATLRTECEEDCARLDAS